MKLYTKTGDDGTTGLFGGRRIRKDDPLMAAIGEVDELNACIGLCAAASRHEQITQVLTALQSRLFELGADLAAPADKAPRIDAEAVAQAEKWIDAACEPVEPIRYFILPGGSELASRLHVARCVARRAERACVAIDAKAPVIFLNRVSDLLFALARLANHLEGVPDVPWRS